MPIQFLYNGKFSLINVLRRFANVVSSSVISQKCRLKLSRDFWQSSQNAEDLLRSQCNYSAIEIADVSVGSRGAQASHYTVADIFKKFGSSLRTLIISNLVIADFSFITILINAPSLEELHLCKVKIHKKLPINVPAKLERLKSITLASSDWLVFQFLIRSQITSLKISSYLDEGEDARANLLYMLSMQSRLRELMLYGTAGRTLFESNVFAEWLESLDTFRMAKGFGKNSNAVERNIINFLKANNEKLRTVEITILNCEPIIGFALVNMRNVTSLTLDVRELPDDQTFHNDWVKTEPNLQLKHLKLTGFGSKSAFFIFILKKCPAITKLELHDSNNTISDSDILKFLSTNFPDLEHLFMPEINKYADVAKFHALNSLHVKEIRDTPNLANFIRLNSSIETLKVGVVYPHGKPAIRRLLELTTIHHLSFCGMTETLRMVLDLIETEPPKGLKTLELTLLRHEEFPICFETNPSQRTVKLHFTDSPTTSHTRNWILHSNKEKLNVYLKP